MVSESSELTLQWDSGGAVFHFDAGAVCLELLTTGGAADHPGFESLRSPENLTDWLATCRLRIDATARAGDVTAAHDLRGAIWTASLAVIDGKPLPRRAVATINEVAASAPPVPVLAGDRWSWAASTGTQALSAIARDAVELFGGPYAHRIRQCASGNCALVFVDLSRPGQRRWCAMERCGNRAKQRTRRTASP
jgi:predicted RNA-binding Zn ribbon-like protein